MSNSSLLAASGCFPPFLLASSFDSTVGFTGGRLCAGSGSASCCLPCPKTDYLYPDNFNTITNAIQWINVVGACCSVFLLVSYAVLPVAKTHRHYLSICLAVATVILQLGFIIPLAAQPEQCADAITPNDMHSSKTCAASGAFLLLGGMCAVMWIFMRALSLHLQICWQRLLGDKFMYGALTFAWGLPVIIVTIAMILSGVSFRFSVSCHINHKNSLADFWIPLLVAAALTVILQFSTFGYCIKVYLASLGDHSATSTSDSSALPSYSGTVRSATPRQAYRRVRRVIELQWRGILLVLLILADVVFFAVVFVFMDNNEVAIASDPAKAIEWIKCLMESAGDKTQCMEEAKALTVNEATVMAVLMLLSCNGIFLLLLLGRFSMFIGWYELATGGDKSENEFVSVDAIAYSKDSSTYEMLSKDTGKAAESIISPISPVTPSGRTTPDFFDQNSRYHRPSAASFSAPRPLLSPPIQSQGSEQYPYQRDPLSMNKF